MRNVEQLLLLLAAWAAMGADIYSGFAPHYSPGLMQRVARNRDMSVVACMVSSPRYKLGTWLVVIGLNTGNVERCRVTDVSHPRDIARHRRTKREVEFSFETALRMCGAKAIRDRPERCPVIVVNLPERIEIGTEGRKANTDRRF
jgi:hypothetical protein